MTLEQSNYYFRFPEEIKDRIDFVHYHPSLEPIKQFRASESSEPFSNSVLNFDYGITTSGKEIGVYKFVNIQNLRENGDINDDEIKYIDDCPEKLQLRENDILISRSRLVGRAVKVTKNFEGEAFGSYIIRFQLNTDSEYFEDFIVKYINCRFGREQVTLLKTGASGDNINSSQLLDIRLPKIDKEQQKSIIEQVRPIESQALSLETQAKDLVNQANKVILLELGVALPEDEIQYFFKRGKLDYSDYYFCFSEDIDDRFHYLSNHPKMTMLEQLRNGRETVFLKNICEGSIHRGVQAVYGDTGIVVLKTVDLKNSYIDYENALHVSQEFFEANQNAWVQRNDIIIAATGYVSMGKIDVCERDEPILISGELVAFTVNKDYDPYFICYYLRSPLGQIQFDKWFSGSSGQIHIYDMEIGQFIVPSGSKRGITIEEQRRIAGLVTEYLIRANDSRAKAREKWQEAEERFEQSIAEVPWL